ncbi:MAG: hypothetical protein NPIRA01_04430 [Nitrospirales bacterium]|nr:MAG: hypothetical protein NPIRA01_04430 [Nitrospirales bacterium]
MRYLNNLLEHNRIFRVPFFAFILFMVLGLTPLSPVYSRNTTLSLQQHQGYWDSDNSMTINQQLVELRGNVARLEAALEQDHRGSLPLVKTQMGMGPMGCGDGGCGQPSSTMKTEKMSGMEKGKMGMMGKMGKGRMQRRAVPQSALPGFPGASHLYHIGGTEFFLDHREHITLAPQQELSINQIKEQALLTQASFDRQVEQAEQELWVLTSSDQPEIRRIESKIRQIEKVKGDQRLAFIRAVGEAARVLTEQQRQILLGTELPQSKALGSEEK